MRWRCRSARDTVPESIDDDDQCAARRCRGDRGVGMVTALVLLFSFTSVGVILLARDYDDRLATRSSAQAIAFQAAREGAQMVDLEQVRTGGVVVLDVPLAREAAEAAGRRLLAEYGETGTVTVTVEPDRVVVVVEIVDTIAGGFSDSREGIVRAEGAAGPESG